jgi:hypothetical protein
MTKPPAPQRPDISPKRGAFPTPQEEIEKATPFVPDLEDNPTHAPSDAPHPKTEEKPDDEDSSANS